MKPRPPLQFFLAATLAATSSAFDFGNGNDVVQTAGTVAPDQATDSLTTTSGVNGFGNFGPSESTATGGGGWPQPAGPGWPSNMGGDQGQTGWPSSPGGDQGQAGWLSSPGGDQGQAGWPSNPGGDQGLAGWPSNPGGDQGQAGWPSNPGGDQGQAGWPSNPGGDQEWGTLESDCSGSNTAGWTPPVDQGWNPPSGDQGWGTLSVDCSGSNGGGGFPGGQDWGAPGSGLSEGGWTPPSGGEGSETLGVDCSNSGGGGGEGSETLGVDCSNSDAGGEGSETLGVDCSNSGGGGGEGSETLGVDCSNSGAGGEGSETLGVDCSNSGAGGVTPSTGSLGGSSAVEGSQEAPAAPTEGSTPTDASSTTETSLTSSNTGDQGASLPSSTGGSSNAEPSPASSNTGDQESSNTGDQTSQTEISPSSETATGSTIGAEADQTSTTTSQSETSQDQLQQTVASGGKTAGGDTVKYVSTWGAPVVAETGTNLASAKASLGKITSKAGGCVIAEPSEYISTKYLDWVWQNRIGPEADTSKKANWNVMANKNWIMDHIVHNKGSLNYCVRWDTDNTLSKEVASKFEGILERHFNAWNEWLDGYNCWPFKQIKINMVGWATKDASQFEWTDNSMGKIYEGVLDPADGVPQCPTECYRFYDNVNNQWSDTSACSGEPYDISFWLKEDIPYGFGYDWGQEVSLNDTMKNLNDKNIMFIGHEIGHGFGLPDFYGMDEKPDQNFPNSIMMAYSSTTITPSDGWMLRRILDHVRDRYNF